MTSKLVLGIGWESHIYYYISCFCCFLFCFLLVTLFTVSHEIGYPDFGKIHHLINNPLLWLMPKYRLIFCGPKPSLVLTETYVYIWKYKYSEMPGVIPVIIYNGILPLENCWMLAMIDIHLHVYSKSKSHICMVIFYLCLYLYSNYFMLCIPPSASFSFEYRKCDTWYYILCLWILLIYCVFCTTDTQDLSKVKFCGMPYSEMNAFNVGPTSASLYLGTWLHVTNTDIW